MKDFREQNYYELLDLPAYASASEIEEAYRRAASTFSADSVAVYALFPPEELSLLRRRIEEAFSVLRDPERRRAYDSDLNLSPPPPPVEVAPLSPPPVAETGAALASSPPPSAPDPVPATAAPAPPPAPPPRPPLQPAPQSDTAARPHPPALPPLGPDTVFDGALLRKIREARGFSLERLADMTKINIYYLRVIEEERFGELPALVYTRGYLRLLASVLKLDPAQVTRTFLERVAKAGS